MLFLPTFPHHPPHSLHIHTLLPPFQQSRRHKGQVLRRTRAGVRKEPPWRLPPHLPGLKGRVLRTLLQPEHVPVRRDSSLQGAHRDVQAAERGDREQAEGDGPVPPASGQETQERRGGAGESREGEYHQGDKET